MIFQPQPIMRNRHLQTLLALVGGMHPGIIPSVKRIIHLSDGDKLCCEESTPKGWVESQPTAILLHGLGGDHRSSYMVRMAYKLFKVGCRVVRMNLRGVGSSMAHSKKIYHGGLSGDLWRVIETLITPQAPSVLIGYSLGGNIALKMAGEKKELLKKYLRLVIAACPPYYLARCLTKMRSSPLALYERYIVKQMRRQYDEWAAHHPDLNLPKVPPGISLSEFDAWHTVPFWGFADVKDYYESSSCGDYIKHISVPCHIICAADDPLIDTESLDSLTLAPATKIWRFDYGGHMGFIALPKGDHGWRWLDSLIFRLVNQEITIA